MKNARFSTKKLGELATFRNGSAFKPTDWSPKGLVIIRIQNLNGSCNFNYFDGDLSRCVQVEASDLLFSWSGSRGTSFGAFRWEGESGVLNQHIFKVLPSPATNASFLFHLLRYATAALESQAHGGAGLVHIKKSVLTDFEVRFPVDPRDQLAMAHILNLAESVQRSSEKLLAAKRAQKRGLMQQLLTGKLRFPGFTEPWKTVRLGDVADIDSELLPASTSPTFAFHYIDLSSVNYGDISAPDKSIDFATAPSRARRVLRRGDVLLSTVRPLLLGFGLLDLAGGPYIGSTGFAVIRTEAKGDARFIFEWLFSSAALRQMHARTTGSSYPALGSADIHGLYLPWPSSSEREKIGALFGAMTKELNLLEQQRAAFAAQRRGLMEKLLSGEIDIQNPKETAA